MLIWRCVVAIANRDCTDSIPGSQLEGELNSSGARHTQRRGGRSAVTEAASLKVNLFKRVPGAFSWPTVGQPLTAISRSGNEVQNRAA
jgi:hypothetical protein